MSADTDSELRDRLGRLRAPTSNGAGGVPATEDLDWFLFQSFPECAVPSETFAELVPVYERALRAGAYFDHELLFVRLLELHEMVGEAALRDVARAAVERLLAGRFEPAEGFAAMRFAVRVLPGDDPFLDDVLERPAQEAFRFRWTVDFVLDERGEREYLALSYLREDDPATAGLMERYAVPAERRRKLAAFFAEDACRERLQRGWATVTRPEERAALAESLRVRLPGFAAE